MKSYEIGIISDLHLGSFVALRREPQNPVQEQLLVRWLEVVPWLHGCDLLVVNGDCNDGLDPKGRNLQVDNVPWQIEEAEALILMLEPKRIRMTYGSSYHVGDTVLYERFLAGYLERRGIDCKIAAYQDIAVGWWKGMFRHATGRSVIPHGRFTAGARSRMWGVQKAARVSKETGKPAVLRDLYCYSHVHYYAESGDSTGRVLVTPGWKAAGVSDNFGAKSFDDMVDIGASKAVVHDPEDAAAGYSIEVKKWPAEVTDESERLV